MPVDGTRVTTLYAYGLPGPPQTFAAKAEGEPVEDVVGVNRNLLRRSLGALIFVFGGLRWLQSLSGS